MRCRFQPQAKRRLAGLHCAGTSRVEAGSERMSTRGTSSSFLLPRFPLPSSSAGPSPVPATTAQRSHSTGSRVSFPPGHSRGSSYRSIPPPSQPIPPPDPDQESRLALSPSGTPVSGSGRSSPAGLHQEAAGDSQKQDHADKERPGKFEGACRALSLFAGEEKGRATPANTETCGHSLPACKDELACHPCWA